jgi:hypothetical protein
MTNFRTIQQVTAVTSATSASPSQPPRLGSADSGIGKEESIEEEEDETFNMPPRITSYSE